MKEKKGGEWEFSAPMWLQGTSWQNIDTYVQSQSAAEENTSVR